MLSRALSLATVALLIGWFAAAPVRAQTQNLEAGKSPSQIFAGTCSACHKSPRGLLKTVSAGSLPGFLREHYTTSSDMASLLSAFLISNGATDTRYGRSQSNPAADAKSGAGPEQADRQGRRTRAGSQEAARPDADGISQQGEPGRQGRKRLARPGEGSDETKPAVDGQAPVQAGDASKLTAKQRLSKRGRPGGEETPNAGTAKSDARSDAAKSDAAKSDTAKSDAGKDGSPKAESKSEPAREDGGKSEGTKQPAGEGEAAKIEGSKDDGGGTPSVLRADPVPPVTPAPQAPAASSAAVSSGASEQAAAPRPSATSEPPRSAVTAAVPSPAPVAAPGPPVPPISQ
jgi:hypothetical protein